MRRGYHAELSVKCVLLTFTQFLQLGTGAANLVAYSPARITLYNRPILHRYNTNYRPTLNFGG